MLIIKLQGGLGNQMFQYAFAKSAQIKNQQKKEIGQSSRNNLELKLDTSYYTKKDILALQKDTPRKYLLDKFNIDEKIATEDEVKKLNPFWFKFYKKIKGKIFGYENQYIFYPKSLVVGDNTYLEGSWQSEKYFQEIADIIKKQFTLKNPFHPTSQKMLDEIKNAENSGKIPVSIHVRRTDYVNREVNAKFFGACSLDYYKSAVEIIKQKISSPNFFIFSDDIEWAKENLDFISPAEFVSNPEIPDYEELILMSKCKHNIIANSSFSWWGAWINQNPNKIVVAPKKWVQKNEEDFKDIIPSEWIRL